MKFMALAGIDVSYSQGFVDWSGVSGAGIAFAYIKATEGISINDSQFARNWSVSSARGVPRGAYHFFRFNDDPIAQANFFLASANPQAGDLLPAVDLESTDGVSDVTQLVRTLGAFTSRVEQALSGRRMMIYTGWGYWNSNFQGSDAFSGHPLWIAEYNNQPAPSLPNGWSNWSIWQHESNGSVAGINGDVDLDVLNGDAAALAAITV
jgi:lysozyme